MTVPLKLRLHKTRCHTHVFQVGFPRQYLDQDTGAIKLCNLPHLAMFLRVEQHRNMNGEAFQYAVCLYGGGYGYTQGDYQEPMLTSLYGMRPVQPAVNYLTRLLLELPTDVNPHPIVMGAAQVGDSLILFEVHIE